MESDDLFSATFEQAAVGIAHVAPDGRWLRVNRKLCDIVGYSHDELVKLTFQDITFPDDLETDLEYVRQVLAGAIKTYSLEKRYIRKDKSIVWINLTVSLVREPSGEPEYFISVVEDIMGRKLAESALRESEARVRNIFDQASDGIYLISADNRYLEVNTRGLEILGYAREELLNMNVADVLAPRERPRLDIEPVEMMAGKPHLAEWEHLRKDGSTFPAEVSARRLDDKTYLAIVRDLTERKKAEADLQRNAQLLRLFVEHSPAAIAMFDLDMKYISASRRFLTDYNLDDQNLVGRSHYDVFPEITDRWKEIHRRCLAGAEEKCDEDPFPRKNGTIDWVRWEIHPWRESTGEIGGIILFSEVITERKQVEAALQESEQNLTEAQRIAHFGSWNWNLTGPVQWTDELYRVYGLSPETFTPTIESFFALVYPEDRPAMQEWMRACGAGESPADFEFRAVRPDGTVRFISGRGELVRDAGGRPIQMAGTAQDITERKQAEQRIARLNRLYSVLSKVNEAIVRIRAPEKLYQEVCRIIVEEGLFRMAWIGLVEPETHLVKPAAIHGHEEGYLKEKHISVDEAIPEGRGPTGTAIREGGYFICNDIENDPLMLPWKGQALKRGYRSSAAFALKSGPRIIGTLNVYSSEVNFFQAEKKEELLLKSLADDLSYAIEGMEIEQQRNRTAEELLQQKNLLSTIIESASDAIFAKDTEGKYQAINEAGAEMLGYGVTEVLGRTDMKLLPAATAGEFRKTDESVMMSGQPYEREETGAIGGMPRTFLTHKTPWRDISGRIVGVIGVSSDITERKKAEEALKEASEFNRQVIESAQEGLVVYGPDLKYQAWNPFMEHLTGLSAGDVLGRHPLKIFPFLREAGVMAALEKALAGETIEATRFQFHIPKTGRSGWASDISAPLRNASGEIIGVIGTVRDITEHVQAEDRLRHAQKMEAIGTLAGGIAHDFNNILNVIIGYGTMVMDELEAGSPPKEEMTEVLKAADRAATLTKRLLVFSRKQAVEAKPLDINDLILGLQKMLGRIIREDIDFKLALSDRPLRVLADAGQIEQVLMNLAANARDAMLEGGGLTIRTGLQELDEEYVAMYGYGRPGRYALITVADTGQGMDEETQRKIFEPFFTTKGIGEGTGLGLAISYGIIKQHNGYIKVYSELGKGTEFKIYLPLLEDSAVLEKKTEISAAVKGGTETILVAEDDVSLRELSRRVLESRGYTVITAEDGEDALTKFMENRERISLALLDMIMPKKNGKEVAEEIGKVRPKTKLLFMSGYTMDIIKTSELTERGFDFIHKPVLPRDLLQKVREVLDR